MIPIRSRAYNVQSSSAQTAQTAQTTHTQPPGHASPLTSALLSHHAVDALNAKETRGNEQEKMLARRAKEAIKNGQLKLSTNLLANGMAQFGMQHKQDMLVIKAELNDRSEYDVLGVGFRRGSETPVAMTLPSPSTAEAGAARRPSGLLSLPNELLLQIAGSTDNGDEGVNLSLRRVNQQMKAVADDQMAPKQRFVVENGQALEALGHTAEDMQRLAARPEEEQHFVLTHGHTLQAIGYTVTGMQDLAARPEEQQHFVLTHGQTLHAAGFGDYIGTFSRLEEDRRNFIVSHLQTLLALDHTGEDIWYLAQSPEAKRNLVVIHGQPLKATGHFPRAMLDFFKLPEDRRDLILAHCRTLHATGFTPEGMREWAQRSEGERNFVLAHCRTLHAAGYTPHFMGYLSTRPEWDIKRYLPRYAAPAKEL